MTLHGVIVPIATPLDAAGEPDPPAIRRLAAFLLDAGVHGIFANGSMGAFALLTDSQQALVIETVVDAVAGRVPVLAGVSDTGTARVLEKVRRHGQLGADALVALPPFFFPCGQEELGGFYHDLAEASPKPIVVYDNPRLAKNSLSAATIVRLAGHPNICGVKLSAPDLQQWQELLAAPLHRQRFSLICGAGRVTGLALKLGFDGITEGLHNLVPGLAVALYRAASENDHGAAAELQSRINRCFEIFEIAGGWRGLDAALREMDLAVRAAPAPYHAPLDPATRGRILAVLERENILSLMRGR